MDSKLAEGTLLKTQRPWMLLHPPQNPLRQNAVTVKEKARYKTVLVAIQHGIMLLSCSVFTYCLILHQLHDFLLILINALWLNTLHKWYALLVTYYRLLLFNGQHFIRCNGLDPAITMAMKKLKRALRNMPAITDVLRGAGYYSTLPLAVSSSSCRWRRSNHSMLHFSHPRQ